VAYAFLAQAVAPSGSQVPAVVAQGDAFGVSRSIKNNLSAAGSTNFSIYLSTDATIDTSDTQVISGSTSSISGGATDTLTVTCTAPQNIAPGAYYVGLLLPNGSSARSSVPAVTIVDDVQLVAVSAPGAPVYVAVSGTFPVSRTISNASASSKTVNFQILLSTDNTIAAGDTVVFTGSAVIPARSSSTLSESCTAPGSTGGPYFLGLYVDAATWLASANAEVTVGSNPFAATSVSVVARRSASCRARRSRSRAPSRTTAHLRPLRPSHST